MCLPVPMAMNEPRNVWPSIVPRTLTNPRVLKNFTDAGQITYVQLPLSVPFRRTAWKRLFNVTTTRSCVFAVRAMAWRLDDTEQHRRGQEDVRCLLPRHRVRRTD